MLLVKSVEILYVNGDYSEILAEISRPLDIRPVNNFVQEQEIQMAKEMVKGIEFCNRDGDSVLIGMTKDVQAAIGLPFQAFNDMGEQIATLSSELARSKKKILNLEKEKSTLSIRLNNICKLGFFKRLKFLFLKRLALNEN